jgi:dihydrofolate synthase/folylpolyglutamate synthase
LRDIAAEKAGIIKHQVPVVSAVEIGEAADVIRACAKAGDCALTLVHRDMEVKDLGLRGNKQITRIDGRELALGLIGPHQVSNAACAVEAMRQLKISEAAVARGLTDTVWSGRFEILSEKPLIVLDGAHNPAGMAMLVETWRAFLAARYGWRAHETDGRARLVFASVADKDIFPMAQLLRPLAREVSLVRLANERGAEPVLLASSFAGLPCACYDSVSAVWQDLATAAPETATLITGSLFLVGEMLARRQGNAEEYCLNERLEKFAVTR